MEVNADINKICKLGTTIRVLLWLICCGILFSNIGLYIFGIDFELFSRASAFSFHIIFTELFFSVEPTHPEVFSIHDSSNLFVKWSWYISTTMCLMIIIFIILQLDKLFKSYSHGVVFHPDNTKGFAIIGWLLVGLYFTDAISSMTIETLFSQAPNSGFIVIGEHSNMRSIEQITGAEVTDLNCMPQEMSTLEFPPTSEMRTRIYSNLTLLLFGFFLIVVARIMSYAESLKKEVDTLI